MMDTFSWDSQRKISLNLSDLKTNCNVNTSYAEKSNAIRDSYDEISQLEQSYTQNLNILLEKSHGTVYEATLLKFLEKKMRDRDLEYRDQATVYNNATVNTSFSSSKVIKKNNERDDSFTRRSKTIDELAQPLSRSMWEGSPSNKNITTNHIGRQRPPTKDSDASDVNELWKTNKKSVMVTNSEFKRWLVKNDTWIENKRKHSQDLSTKLSEEIQASAPHQPRITALSVSLAEIAWKKKEQKDYKECNGSDDGSQIDDCQVKVKSPFNRPKRIKPRPSSASPMSCRVGDSGDASPVAGKDVFSRLTRDGERHSTLRRSWNPLNSSEFTFSPHIRSSSPLTKRLSDAPDIPVRHTKKSRSASPVIAKSSPYFAGSGGKVYPPGGLHVSINQNQNSKGISSSKNNPKESKRIQVEIMTLPSGERMFHPHLAAPETKAIMAHLNDTFEDRVVKSIENDLVKRQLAKSAESPGPGYYSNNIHKSNDYSPLKPFRNKTGSVSKGYSFGKQKRNIVLTKSIDRESILSANDNKRQSVNIHA